MTVQCLWWDKTVALWKDSGCAPYSRQFDGDTEELQYITCECDHLSEFAVHLKERPPAPEPLPEPKTFITEEQAIFGMVTCVIVFICFISYLVLWKEDKTSQLPSEKK